MVDSKKPVSTEDSKKASIYKKKEKKDRIVEQEKENVVTLDDMKCLVVGDVHLAIEVLRKALEDRPKHIPNTKPCSDWVKQYLQWFEDFTKKFSVFLTDYNKQRKQLSDDWMLKCKTDDCIHWCHGDCSYGFDYRQGHCPDSLKELLEAGLGNIPHEKETAKK